MGNDPQQQVHRRRVFYIPGYDPIHPRRYRELYRKEGAAQAAISGYDIDLSAKTGEGPYGWRVRARIDESNVQTQVDVLIWSDIVRTSMSNSVPATYLQLVRTAWAYIGSGALWRLMRLRKGPVIAALYPVGFLLLQLVLAVFTGAVVVWTGKAALIPALGVFGHMLALAAGVALAYAVMRWFRRQDNRFYAYYLMHDFAYSAHLNGAYSAQMEDRIRVFTDLVAGALTSDVDEVLVVGHSSGAYVGVSVLSDLIRAGRVPKGGPALGFLSLGQVVPMVSFLPGAHRLRADLKYLSARNDISWIDVSAPGDGCSFALCDPVGVSGVAPPEKKWPLVVSAAFTQTLSPDRWAALRWRFFRLHFQYLCAFDQPGDYDYFQITAGPKTLGGRYADRAPSRSRKETPVSKYTTVAA